MESYYRVGYVSTSIAYRIDHQLFPSLVHWLAFSQAQGEDAYCQVNLDSEIFHFCTIIQPCAFSCKIRRMVLVVWKHLGQLNTHNKQYSFDSSMKRKWYYMYIRFTVSLYIIYAVPKCVFWAIVVSPLTYCSPIRWLYRK